MLMLVKKFCMFGVILKGTASVRINCPDEVMARNVALTLYLEKIHGFAKKHPTGTLKALMVISSQHQQYKS